MIKVPFLHPSPFPPSLTLSPSLVLPLSLRPFSPSTLSAATTTPSAIYIYIYIFMFIYIYTYTYTYTYTCTCTYPSWTFLADFASPGPLLSCPHPHPSSVLPIPQWNLPFSKRQKWHQWNLPFCKQRQKIVVNLPPSFSLPIVLRVYV